MNEPISSRRALVIAILWVGFLTGIVGGLIAWVATIEAAAPAQSSAPAVTLPERSRAPLITLDLTLNITPAELEPVLPPEFLDRLEAAAGETLAPEVPGWHGPLLTRAQVFGLALYVSGDEAWAAWARDTFACESGAPRTGRAELAVGAIGPTDDHGIPQINDPTWGTLADTVRARRDPVYALTVAWLIYQEQGATAWACNGGG